MVPRPWQELPPAALVTQNVDGLHQAGGARDVVEIHGTMARTRCQRCGRKDGPERLLEEVQGLDDRPACRHCGGPLRPDVVLFEEPLPQEATERAFKAAERCRLFLVVGSSLQVAPVASLSLPGHALLAQATLGVINLDPTPYDGQARWLFREPAGQVLTELGKRLGLD